MRKGIHKNSGFSVTELMITIAVIGLLAAIAIPNMIGWRSGARLQGAVENLRGDLQLAKLKAVQENTFVAVLFSGTEYFIFTDIVDVGTGNDAGEYVDGTPGERLLRRRQLETSVSIDLGSTGFAGNLYARFNNRGLPEDDGEVVIISSGGRPPRTIRLSRLGRIDIQ